MPELGTFGSVRGVAGNGHSYRDQYFCGEVYLQTEAPIDPSSLTRWRKRIGEEGVETLLMATIEAARRGGVVRASSVGRVIVDTTVMPKAIAHPTDSRLLEKSRQHLVKVAEEHGLSLRQNKVSDLLARTGRILTQRTKDRNKLYALHAPEVECISKGKARTPYEFGVKVSIATTLKEGLVVGMRSMPGNPYDSGLVTSNFCLQHFLIDLDSADQLISITDRASVVPNLGYQTHPPLSADALQVCPWACTAGSRRSHKRTLRAKFACRQPFPLHFLYFVTLSVDCF